jgi:copper chaperone CopZ
VPSYNEGLKTRFKWHRALVNPTTHVESVDGDVTMLRVDGLVCSSVCAARTKQALRAIDGVRRVDVDIDAGVARIEGATQPPEVYERAVTSVVAGKPVRRAIEWVASRGVARTGNSPQRRGEREGREGGGLPR